MSDNHSWNISIEVCGEEPGASADFETRVAALAAALEAYSAVVSATPDRSRYRATFSVDGPADAGTISEALKLFTEHALAAQLPAWPVARIEALRRDESEAATLDRPVPDLVGIVEISRALGISRQRASKLTKLTGFPEPVAELVTGPVWTRPALERFVEDRIRKPRRTPVSPGDDELPEVAKLREHVNELTNRLHHASDPVEAGIISAELRAISAQLHTVMETAQPPDVRSAGRVANPKIITVDPVWPVEPERGDAPPRDGEGP